MTADLIEEYLSAEGWKWQFDTSVILQGKRVMRGRSVLMNDPERLDDDTLMLSAQVSGNDGVIFEVEVVLWEGEGGIQAEGSCSCDFANQCQHAAAVLHQCAKAHAKELIVGLFSENSVRDSSSIQQWTESLKKIAVEPNSTSERSAEVLYILKEKSGSVLLQVRSVDLTKAGLRRGELKTPQMSQSGFSQAFQKSDRIICRSLLGYEKSGVADWDLSGEGMSELFNEILKTGRCYWLDPSSQALQVGHVRRAKCDWLRGADEARPVLSASPPISQLLMTEPFWYIDAASGEAGVLECDAGYELAREWLNGPVVSVDDHEEINLQLAENSSLSQLEAPVQDQGAEVTPELQFEMVIALRELKSKGLKQYLQSEEEILAACVYVNYGKYRFSLTGARQAGVERVQTSRGVETVTRDLQEEGRALQLLQNLGLISPVIEAAGMGESLGLLSEEERSLWICGIKDFTQEQYWTSFMSRRAEKMRADGWSVTFDGDEPQPIDVSASALTIQMEEAGSAWFALSAGFIVDQKQYELQPILADLLEMGALEKESELLDEDTFFYYPKGSKDVLCLPSARMKVILGMLRGLLMEFSGTKTAEVPVTEAALLVAENDEIEAPEELRKLGKRLKNPRLEDPSPKPGGLQATLRSYQEEGFQWMQMLARYELHGILADDMGLGKTLQTLAHILAEKESGRSKGLPSLILAPTSVVNNWKAESKKWTPVLSVLILQGSQRKKLFAQMATHDIVVTSYALLARDIDQLKEQRFHIAALDEAQHIKTPGTQVAQAARELQARHRLCLSGTPIENHLGELWSLMAFLMPGLLGKHDDFTAKVRTPIEKHQDEDARQRLVRQVGPLILRRTKDEVAKDLPPKTEIIHTIELNDQQKDLYETVRVLMDKRVRDAVAAAGMESSNIVFLDALMKLRQICCHPQILDKKEAQLITESAKLTYLADQLDTLISENRKVLIFSQFTSMLDLIEAHVKQRGFSYLKLTGASQNRQDMVDIFQEGETDIFMISLKAGGTGLTLTAADNVIHYDPWWNPAAENQATDRAYRIGQDKPVFVHKLICKDTVEQRIQELQASKSELADALLDGSTHSFTLTEDTLASLLSPMLGDGDSFTEA